MNYQQFRLGFALPYRIVRRELSIGISPPVFISKAIGFPYQMRDSYMEIWGLIGISSG